VRFETKKNDSTSRTEKVVKGKGRGGKETGNRREKNDKNDQDLLWVCALTLSVEVEEGSCKQVQKVEWTCGSQTQKLGRRKRNHSAGLTVPALSGRSVL
jgi:hypothetical protein